MLSCTTCKLLGTLRAGLRSGVTLLLFDFPEQEVLWSLCPPACSSSRVPQVFRAFGNHAVWGSADVLRSGESSCRQNAAVRPADCPLYPYVCQPAGDFSSTRLSATHPLQLSCACAYWWWWYQSEKEFKLHKKQKQLNRVSVSNAPQSINLTIDNYLCYILFLCNKGFGNLVIPKSPLPSSFSLVL